LWECTFICLGNSSISEAIVAHREVPEPESGQIPSRQQRIKSCHLAWGIHVQEVRAVKARKAWVLVSSVLFTAELLYLLPAAWNCAMAGRNQQVLANLDAGYKAAAQCYGELGIAALTIIAIGLLVTWTGFIRRVRSAWFVMFIIVWAWAFPNLVLPLFLHSVGLTAREWIQSALRSSGPARVWAENVVIFLMMVISLVLPLKAFFMSTSATSSSAKSQC
jgi:hypothetical protein